MLNLARERLLQLYADEVGRTRRRVDELRERYPSAQVPELAQRLIDSKKNWGGTGGAVAGLFGLFAIPADAALVTVLQLSLIMEIALLYRVNLKSERARSEVLEVLGYCNGKDAANLAGRAPFLVSRVAQRVLGEVGLSSLGRAVPVVAAPLVAFLNARDLQRAGDTALRYYGTLSRLPPKPASAGL